MILNHSSLWQRKPIISLGNDSRSYRSGILLMGTNSNTWTDGKDP
jgi:hypothetical protein